METKTVSNRMSSLIVLFDMHSDYFKSAIEGISDKDACNRLGTKANHIAWIAGSIVYERYELARSLGVDLKQSTDELFKNHKGIEDNASYPSLSEFKKDWEIITPLLKDALINVTDEKLDSIFTMPDMSMPFYDLVAFMQYREANCIGQIALWRRLLGYDAMKYM